MTEARVVRGMAPAHSPLPARRPIRLAILPALMLGLAGCDDEATPRHNGEPVYPAVQPASEPRHAPAELPPQGYTDGSGINEHYPDLAPKQLAADLEGSEAGARNVLLAFARAIELREYDQAWDMLNDSAKERLSLSEFNALWTGLKDITVAVPDGTMEGAAGSLYYTSQAEITASDSVGRPIRLEGPVVLRRVNDVPGASEEQLRWHVEGLDLTPTH